jgi:hypothetical protein
MGNKFWESEDTTFDLQRCKDNFISNMDFIASMSVEEQTLYKKWIELNGDLLSNFEKLPRLSSYYDLLWFPTDMSNYDLTISEINSLEPYAEIANDNETNRWIGIRKLIHTMSYDTGVGRNLKVYIKDRNTGKILGLINLSSDVTSLGVRDKHIGWTKDNKFVDGKLNNTTIASTIVSVQPLGYNMLGGKLVSLLATSPVIRDEWYKRYNDVLVGITTTSLYGIHSQYNGLPNFKTLGESKGMISIKPDDSVYEPMHHYVKELDPIWYAKAMLATGPKQNVLKRIFKEFDIKPDKYNHGFKRGVYFAGMYENGNDYLCSKIEVKDLILKPKFIDDTKMIQWWKKHAVSRYTKLYNENRLKNETLYYIDVIGMTWDECKEKYLQEVGR